MTSRLGLCVIGHYPRPPPPLVLGFNFATGLECTPTADGTGCELVYMVHSDIGGWVPTALVNKSIGGALTEVVTKLIAYAEATPN